MKHLWKTRKAKKSDRGIYIQDAILEQTDFQIGKKYEYILDVNTKKLIILPTEEKGNTVARRTYNKGIKPVIDIRKREVVELFDGYDQLLITIYNDEITIEGLEEKKKSESNQNFISKTISRVKSAFRKNEGTAEVLEIDELLKRKSQKKVVFSRKQLLKAAGAEQLSFELFSEWDIVGTSSQNNIVNNVQEALKNLHIPLLIGSWFCGAGVMDEGYKQEGFKFGYSIEKDEMAAETYRYNHGNHCIVGDVTEIDKSKLPKVPVMIAGVPCRSFTKVNRRKRLLEHEEFFLFKEYIEGIKQNEECMVWMIENVEEFLTSLDGYCIKELERLLPDFEITYGILNSADYGTPMIRKRAIIIGSKIGRIELPEPMYSKDEYTTVRDALEGITNDLPNQLDVNNHKPLTIERMKHIPEGGNHWDLPQNLREGLRAQFSDYLKRLKWDAPSISMVHPRKNLIMHPEENRVLSVREIARIFGLPDSFVFKGAKLDSRQKQIANAVAVNMVKAVAKKVKNTIFQFNIRNRKEPVYI